MATLLCSAGLFVWFSPRRTRRQGEARIICAAISMRHPVPKHPHSLAIPDPHKATLQPVPVAVTPTSDLAQTDTWRDSQSVRCSCARCAVRGTTHSSHAAGELTRRRGTEMSRHGASSGLAASTGPPHEQTCGGTAKALALCADGDEHGLKTHLPHFET